LLENFNKQTTGFAYNQKQPINHLHVTLKSIHFLKSTKDKIKVQNFKYLLKNYVTFKILNQ